MRSESAIESEMEVGVSYLFESTLRESIFNKCLYEYCVCMVATALDLKWLVQNQIKGLNVAILVYCIYLGNE